MKNSKELNQDKKKSSTPTSTKGNTSAKEESKSQDRKKGSTIEAEKTETMNSDSNNRKPLFRK